MASVVLLLHLAFAPQAHAQGDGQGVSFRPELQRTVDAPLFASGAVLLVVGSSLHVTNQLVPPEGLTPDGIRWSADRDVIGNLSERANGQSDHYRNAALIYPIAISAITQPGGTLRRSVLYAEALGITVGLTFLLKNSFDRPRPYTYVPADQRPSDSNFDVTRDEAFRSMPSGHTSVAFCAAGFVTADHIYSRPHVGWAERVAVPFAGGFLAGMTSGLRVEGGQHFPSDVIVGALIGTATGVAVPVLHQYVGVDGQRSVRPSGREWGRALVGLALGVGGGLLVAQSY